MAVQIGVTSQENLCAWHRKRATNSENNADVNKEKAGEETYKSLLQITGTKEQWDYPAHLSHSTRQHSQKQLQFSQVLEAHLLLPQ